MWARKIGVPPFWASQIKVLVLSGGTAGVGIAVYAFMMNLSIGQLDLASPRNEGMDAPQCFMASASGTMWRADAKMLHELRQRIKHGKPAQQLPNVFDCIASVTNSSCSAVEIPVVSLNGHMLAMAGRIDWLRLWAKVFLVLSFLLLLGITTHDLALLNVTKKTEIMDLRRLRWQFPVLRKAFALATGLSGMRRLLRQSGVGSRGAALLAKLCIPLLILWNLGLAVFVLSPIFVALFVTHPIRLSRAAVFVQSIVCAIYSLILFIQLVVWLLHRAIRPWYALTWMTKGEVSLPAAHLLKDVHPSILEADCLCGCDYAVSNYALLQLVTIAVTSLVKSLMVAFRCLKGLRNAQWANLITVLFNIPINIYPVTWASIDAELPPGATEETETQAEPAFDPFVLMDEQLSSGNLRLELSAAWSWNITSPRGGDVTPRAADAIGCCGFPYARSLQDPLDPGSPTDSSRPLLAA